MAIAVGADPDEVVIRLLIRDVDGEEVVKTFALSGDADDTDVANICTYFDALTNAAVVKASVVSSRPITGWASATDALQNSIGMIMALTFQKTNPINPNKTVSKAFIVPAFVNALKGSGTPIKPVIDNTNLNNLTAALEDLLQYEGADGEFYPGSWEYSNTASGFGTVNREIDGL